jgi:hypothetical protein
VIKIPVGKNPDAIIYDPASGHVFTFNGASHDITASHRLLKHLATGGRTISKLPSSVGILMRTKNTEVDPLTEMSVQLAKDLMQKIH